MSGNGEFLVNTNLGKWNAMIFTEILLCMASYAGYKIHLGELRSILQVHDQCIEPT